MVSLGWRDKGLLLLYDKQLNAKWYSLRIHLLLRSAINISEEWFKFGIVSMGLSLYSFVITDDPSHTID